MPGQQPFQGQEQLLLEQFEEQASSSSCMSVERSASNSSSFSLFCNTTL
jgi:hypothetical protein